MRTKAEVLDNFLINIGNRYCTYDYASAMDEYAKEVAIDFTNWTAEGDCPYIMSDEDQWTHMESQENITTGELFQFYIKQKT